VGGKVTCGPIPGEAVKPPGTAIFPQRHITEERRSATVRAAGTFLFVVYHLNVALQHFVVAVFA
jgi:hypothetical protein